jgi:choline dehydrogenase-like flavoprotein
MPQHFDVVVVGMGPGGEVAASRLLEEGAKVSLAISKSPGSVEPSSSSRTLTLPSRPGPDSPMGQLPLHDRHRPSERLAL